MKIRPLIFLLFSILFLGTGITLRNFLDAPVTAADLAAPIARALQNDLQLATREADTLLSDPSNNQNWINVTHSFFLVDSGKIKAWSKNDFVPEWHSALSMFSEILLQTSSGDYLLKKWPLKKQSFLLVVITLRKNYDLVNNYLNPQWNSSIFKEPVRIFDLSTRLGAPVCVVTDGCLFSIEPSDERSPLTSDYFTLLFFGLAIVAFIFFVTGFLWRYHQEKKYQSTFLGLTAFLVGLRITLVELDFPNVLIKFHWFDPKQFASSSFNASIGDLFLNSLVVLILCLYLFSYYTRFPVVKRILRANNTKQRVAAAALVFIAFLALLFPFLFGEIIYHNSSISLEITSSLMFDSTRIIAFLSLLTGCCCGFLILHVSIRLMLLLNHHSVRLFIPSLIVSSLVFLVFFLITGRNYWITLIIGSGLFSLLYVFRLTLPLSRLTFKSFLYFLVIVIAFALQGTLSIRHFQQEKKRLELLRYGNNFLVDEDVLGEYLLNESIHRISNDPFIQMRLYSPFLQKTSVRQKIRLFYLPGYFDRYDVQVYLYNAHKEPYEDNNEIDFDNSLTAWQKEAYRTVYPGIYFVNNPSAEATKKYVAVVPVKGHYGSVAGYVVLNLTLKKIIPQNVYPELLVDNRFSQYAPNADISYAYYSQGKLTSSFGDFNYEKDFEPKWLTQKPLFKNGITAKGFQHVGIEDSKDRIVVVTSSVYPLFFTGTNFSFFFILGLVLILSYLFITGFIAVIRGRRLNYSSRIQLYVYLAFFFPLLAVSITTLSLMSRSNKDRITREYGEKANILSERIANPLQQFQKGSGETQSEFQNHVIELAKLTNADASIYTPDGTLLASSQPAIFENHLVSHFISRKAWNAIVAYHDNTFMADENIGKLNYSCSYAAIKSPETGALLGILSIPFFSSAASLEQSRITVLANILTVFVIIFILFSFLSFFIAKGLTFPLRFITQSLQKTSLTETNQRIVWNSKDEIGLLANEYNRMVQNLEQSRAELVRSQKESTWREIAKQVAHEIKNPLTPMKLTLQQWELNLARGEMSPERSQKSIEILLTQLETLNDIAGSFSAFARMPAPARDRIELVSLLRQASLLHGATKEASVIFEPKCDAAFIMGDEQLFGRIFSNLIINALQSSKDNQPVIVHVRISIVRDQCRIEIQDDGAGIEPWVRDRVFLPHFSTKKTGSGLGLAIVRQGIEQSGGTIWFETATGKGTTFFMELPLVES